MRGKLKEICNTNHSGTGCCWRSLLTEKFSSEPQDERTTFRIIRNLRRKLLIVRLS
ncbi:hypothetical protein CDAR_292541, partial [Caerostris darwini]